MHARTHARTHLIELVKLLDGPGSVELGDRGQALPPGEQQPPRQHGLVFQVLLLLSVGSVLGGGGRGGWRGVAR